MSKMNISGSSGSTAGVQNHSSETQRSRSTGDLSKNLQSVKNKTEQKSEALSRISSISRLPKGQPNIEPSKSIRVPQGPGGIPPQITQMGVYTLDSGNGGTSTSLKINVPARHVGDPLVKYSLAKMGNDETFVRTLDRKERMALIADSENNSAGNKLISTKGIQCGDKIIPWDNFIAWQKPETSTFDKPNNAAKLILFFRKGEGVAVLNEANRLNLNHLCKTTETLDCFYPARLCNKSPDLQEIKVSEYVDSLIHEFGTAVPERVTLTKLYAEAMDSYGKDKLYHLRKNIDAMCTDSNGKSREVLGLSHRYRHEQAKGVSEAKKTYAQGIKALSADWSISAENWSDNDTLRCAVIENVIKSGHANRISDADAKKYFPTIYTSKRFNQYINTVYANSGYQIALRSMVNSNDFSGIQGINEVSPRARAENIKSAISNLEELALLNPKKIRRELKRNEKELLNHLEQNSILDKDVKTLAYGKEIDKLSNQLNLLKNKAYRKEISSFKMELKKITELEPGSMEHMVATSLSRNNVQSKYSEKSIDTLRALRDEKVLGLRGNENKHERECLRQQIAWLDNHIESVVETYYGFLSLKDKVDFLLQESDIAWGKYADYLRKPVDKELVRKYHHMAITRNSQLKYLISAIKKISNENYIFSPGDIEHISNQISNPNCLCIPDIPDGIKFDKKVFRSLEKTRDSFSKFSTWAWYQKYNATHDPVSRNTLRNNKLSSVSIKKNEPLADSDNVEKSLQVKDNVNPKNKDTLRKEIINEIDFKKYNSQIDGEIAVLALYSYLAERNVQLNILRADKKSRVPIELIAAGRGLNIKEPPKTDNSVSIILDRRHYSGFDPKKEITYPSKGDGNCLFHSVANMLKNNGIKIEGINKIVDGVYLNQLTKEHFNNNFDKFIAAFFNSDDESDTTNGKRTKALFHLVKEYKNLPLETVESGATASGDANSGDVKLTYDLSDEEVVRENIDDVIDELLAGNTSLSKAGDDVPTAEDPHPDEPLTTETTAHQSNESVEDLNSDNKSMASTGATASGGINFHEINVNGYAFKSIKDLEEKANTISNSAKKERLLKTIKELKSAFRKMRLKTYEVTENGITYTVSQKQKDLNVEVKYFFDSKFELNEDATEYKPISGKGTLKIPGVEGEIGTILGCTYKRMQLPILTSVPEVFPDGFSSDDIIAAKKFLSDKSVKYEYVRTMSKSEMKHFISDIKEKIERQSVGITKTRKKISSYFKGNDQVKNKTDGWNDKYNIKNIFELMAIKNSQLNEISNNIKSIESKLEKSKDESYLKLSVSEKLKFRNEMTKEFDKQKASLLKDFESKIMNAIANKGLELKDGMYTDFINEMVHLEQVTQKEVIGLKGDTTLTLGMLKGFSDSNFNITPLSLSFGATPLEISIGSIFLQATHSKTKKTDTKGVVEIYSESGEEIKMLFPSGIIINKFESVRKGNDTMYYGDDGKNKNKLIVINDEESIGKVFENLKTSAFNIDALKSGSQLFAPGNGVMITRPKLDKPLDQNSIYKFDNAKYEYLTAAASVESAPSSVNGNMVQALPQPSQVPSQSLHEKAANKATISGKEIRRKYSSAHPLTSNNNAATAQNNEHEVADEQNTGNIKHHYESVISTDGVRQSQKSSASASGDGMPKDYNYEKLEEDMRALLTDMENDLIDDYNDALISNALENISPDVKSEMDIHIFVKFVKDIYLKEINLIEVSGNYNKEPVLINDILDEESINELKKENINILDHGDGSFQLITNKKIIMEKEDIFQAVSRALNKNKFNGKKIADDTTPEQLKWRNSARHASYQNISMMGSAGLPKKVNSYDVGIILGMRTPKPNGGGNDDKIQEIKKLKQLFEDIKSGRHIHKDASDDKVLAAVKHEYEEMVSGREFRSQYEPSYSLAGNSNEATIQNNEHAVTDEQPASALDKNASILKVADDSSHVSKSSESDDNETVGAQPSNGTPAGKAPKEFFSKRELNRILSRQSVLVQ